MASNQFRANLTFDLELYLPKDAECHPLNDLDILDIQKLALTLDHTYCKPNSSRDSNIQRFAINIDHNYCTSERFRDDNNNESSAEQHKTKQTDNFKA